MAVEKINIRLSCMGCAFTLLLVGLVIAAVAGLSVKLFNWIV